MTIFRLPLSEAVQQEIAERLSAELEKAAGVPIAFVLLLSLFEKPEGFSDDDKKEDSMLTNIDYPGDAKMIADALRNLKKDAN